MLVLAPWLLTLTLYQMDYSTNELHVKQIQEYAENYEACQEIAAHYYERMYRTKIYEKIESQCYHAKNMKTRKFECSLNHTCWDI